MTFTHLAATRNGQTAQVNRAYKTMAADLKRKQIAAADCDDLTNLSHQQLISLVMSLQNQLADALALIEQDRTAAYDDVPSSSVDTSHWWNTQRVCKESGGVSVSQVTRHAKELHGVKISNTWLFPPETTYKRKRNRK